MLAPTTCTSAAFRGFIIHQNESARQRAPEFAKAQRQRKKVEALFAELKNQIGLQRLRLWRLRFVREQFFLAVAAQAISGVSQSADNTGSTGYNLVEPRLENRRRYARR